MKIQPITLLSKVSLCAGLVVSSLLFLPGHGIAQNVTLTNGSSTATIDLGSGQGMDNWSVLGQNQLIQQWFYYSIGTGPVQAINSIGLYSQNQYGQNNYLDAIYKNSQLSIEVTYTLSGTGPGNADITETIAVDNLSGSSFNLNLFQYSNFNLLQSGNNTLQIYGNPGAYTEAVQTSGSTSIAEGIVSPYATAAEANFAATTMGQINAGSLHGDLFAGPGDVAWGFEWSTSVDAGGEFDLTKDKSLSVSMVPEPSTFALIGLGIGALGLMRRRSS